MFAAFIANNIYYLLLSATINSYIVARTVHISLSTQRCIFFTSKNFMVRDNWVHNDKRTVTVKSLPELKDK